MVGKEEVIMTREEQIIEAGIDLTMRTRPVCRGGLAFEKEMREFNRSKMFEAGAQWADEHPKQGLINIDKACELVEFLIRPYVGPWDIADVVESFRKAMEE